MSVTDVPAAQNAAQDGRAPLPPSWAARMIAPDEDFEGAPLLRREITLEEGHGEVRHATLHLSALGVCEAWINQTPVSGELLTPGWTSYEWRLRYASHDVTALLDGGPTVLGVALGNGWYRGKLGWKGDRDVYGEELGAWVQLEIEFADGHRQLVCSDESWQAGPSAVTANDLYDGQSIDARRHDDSWLRPGAPPAGWGGVHALDFDPGLLTPYLGPGVVRVAEIAPVRVWTSPAGATLVDFGQNLVGWIRVRVGGAAGDVVTLRHAEVLEDGELGTRPLRSALATDQLTLSGSEDVFEPTLTFHGFRYAEVTGWPGEEIEPGALTAVVVSSELQRLGHFECSEPLLNQLFENVVWGMRGNFVDVPTDCPQRDERLGWTGDLAVFAPAAAFLHDVRGFLTDWLADLAAEQSHADGVIPFVVPDLLKRIGDSGADRTGATAVWSDAGVWVPWALWEAYGDAAVLESSLDSMLAHVRRVRSQLSPSGLWDTGFQFGDWLDPAAPADNPAQAKADPGVVATASAYRSAVLTARAAGIVGRTAEQQECEQQAAALRAAFTEHYVDAGRVHSDCQTVYALAIAFDLLSEQDRVVAGERLAELVRAEDHRIGTGFAGTSFVTEALTATGHLEEVYGLVLQTECPSWLYPVTMGATTIWERWDSMLPDGSINPGEMTSFNHYAYGSVADWMRRTIGGLAPLDPGYGRILVAPRPGGGITSASTSLETPHGLAAVSWQLAGDRLTLDVTVPTSTTAVVRLDGQPEQVLRPGRHTVTG